MLIICPTCATTYRIELAALGAAGRSVRCAHCKNTWFATPDSVVEERAPVPAAATHHSSAQASADEFAGVEARPAQEVLLAGDPGGGDSPFTVGDAPPLVPHDHPETPRESAPKFDPGLPDGAETIAVPRVRRSYVERKDQRSLLRRMASLPMLVVAMLAILLATLNWRAAVVRQFPQTASLYAAIGLPVNLRGLFFEDVKSRSELHDGVTVLIVEGTIVNLTTRTLEVPRLRLSLRNGVGHEVYAWTALPSKSTLGSGNGLPFRARLASPPPDGRDVIVRFFNRRDAMAGPL